MGLLAIAISNNAHTREPNSTSGLTSATTPAHAYCLPTSPHPVRVFAMHDVYRADVQRSSDTSKAVTSVCV
eukprot:6213135-Pleurochrysis_carterae.AAC.3